MCASLKVLAGVENTESHCALLRVPGFPRGLSPDRATLFRGLPGGKSCSASVHVCVCVSRAIMPADVRLYIFLQRGGAMEFQRSRRAEFMCPNRTVGHQSSIPATEMLSTYIFLAFKYFMVLFYFIFVLYYIHISKKNFAKINQYTK